MGKLYVVVRTKAQAQDVIKQIEKTIGLRKESGHLDKESSLYIAGSTTYGEPKQINNPQHALYNKWVVPMIKGSNINPMNCEQLCNMYTVRFDPTWFVDDQPITV